MLQIPNMVLIIVLLGVLWPPSTPDYMRPNPHAQTVAVAEGLRGLVIRDPWYDFGTIPSQPNQPNFAAQDEMGRMLALLGVTWVRLEFHIEAGTAREVEAQIARNDYFINEVAPRHKLKVLGLLGFNLQRGRDEYDLLSTKFITDTVYGGGVNDYMQIWLDRARLIADRYQDRVLAYEVLNEQNRLPPDGRPIPADVAARLHTKFYRFFRNVDRNRPGDQRWRENVKIILGGLHPAGSWDVGSSKYVSDRDYIRQLYRSDGFRSYRENFLSWPLDGLGYHPYPEEIRVSPQSDMNLITTRMNAVRDVLREVGDPFVPFWITELGYNAGFRNQTTDEQAEFLRQSILTMASRDDVETFFWFKYEDFPPATGPNAQLWGVVRIPFTEDNRCAGGACYDLMGRPDLLRPAFWTMRELTGVQGGLPEPPAEIVLNQRGTVLISPTLELSPTTLLTLTATINRPSVQLPVTVTWAIEQPPNVPFTYVQVLTDTNHLTSTLVLSRTLPAAFNLNLTASNTAATIQQQGQVTFRELRGRAFLPFIIRQPTR